MHASSSNDPQALEFPESRDLADLKNFATRAKAVQDSGIRLQANGEIAIASVCVLRPGLLGEATPVVLGVRTLALARPAQLDCTVPLAAILERIAHTSDGTTLAVPPAQVRESWAGVSVPRGPWEPVATLPAEGIRAAAEAGITRVAGIVPNSPGALIVNNARATVWGEAVDLAGELNAQERTGVVSSLPRGAAFAAHMLGFTPAHDGELRLFRHGNWLRLSSALGHVLVRQPGA